MDEYLYKTDDIFADQEAEENIIGCTDWKLDNPWKDTWIDARYKANWTHKINLYIILLKLIEFTQ